MIQKQNPVVTKCFVWLPVLAKDSTLGKQTNSSCMPILIETTRV